MVATASRTPEQQRRKEVEHQLRREQGKPININNIKLGIKLGAQKTL